LQKFKDANQITELNAFRTSFLDHYLREFGFTISDRAIIVDDVRVRVIGRRHFSSKVSPQKTCSNVIVDLVKCEAFFPSILFFQSIQANSTTSNNCGEVFLRRASPIGYVRVPFE
jgi:hypothetical protein